MLQQYCKPLWNDRVGKWISQNCLLNLDKQAAARLQTAGSFCCLPFSVLILKNSQKLKFIWVHWILQSIKKLTCGGEILELNGNFAIYLIQKSVVLISVWVEHWNFFGSILGPRCIICKVELKWVGSFWSLVIPVPGLSKANTSCSLAGVTSCCTNPCSLLGHVTAGLWAAQAILLWFFGYVLLQTHPSTSLVHTLGKGTPGQCCLTLCWEHSARLRWGIL